jgi:hypothetical protein
MGHPICTYILEITKTTLDKNAVLFWDLELKPNPGPKIDNKPDVV